MGGKGWGRRMKIEDEAAVEEISRAPAPAEVAGTVLVRWTRPGPTGRARAESTAGMEDVRCRRRWMLPAGVDLGRSASDRPLT